MHFRSKLRAIPVQFIVLLSIVLTSCNSGKSQVNNESRSALKQDSIALTHLVRELYEWQEGGEYTPDFETVTGPNQDTAYIGIDWEMHKARLQELRSSQFFSTDFLNNYDHIARTIDSDLQSGKSTWLAGELPPYGNDASPWFNAQDNPDNFWKTMQITHLQVRNDKATFQWTWGGDFYYAARAIKIAGNWKIDYLEGFDYADYFHLK